MAVSQPFNIYIGWDGREAVATEVAAHSIRRRTTFLTSIQYLKHRELRKRGFFSRPWLIDGAEGNFLDLIDSRPFSTEFSHTRFLVPALQEFKGWALFMDSDMIFLDDVKRLFKLADDRYAVMVVKHQQQCPQNAVKMDGRLQQNYYRKNWSSFMLFNCAHPSNAWLTKQNVNFARGGDMHRLCWLRDEEIGSLPSTYNYISGVSPKLPPVEKGIAKPAVIHYTEGGPWFNECKEVPYADLWTAEYEDWQREQGAVSEVPSISFDLKERMKGVIND